MTILNSQGKPATRELSHIEAEKLQEWINSILTGPDSHFKGKLQGGSAMFNVFKQAAQNLRKDFTSVRTLAPAQQRGRILQGITAIENAMMLGITTLAKQEFDRQKFDSSIHAPIVPEEKELEIKVDSE